MVLKLCAKGPWDETANVSAFKWTMVIVKLVASTTTSLLWFHQCFRVDCTIFLLVILYLCKAELLAVVIISKCGVKMNVNENGVFNLIPRCEKSCSVQHVYTPSF